MGKTIAMKIFSSHCKKNVSAGQLIIADVDLAMATDGSGPLTIDIFYKMGKEATWDPSKIVFVLDHYVPCPNDKVSRLHDMMRQFHTDGNCGIFELGEGICHQLLPEMGLVKPGDIIVGGDSHSCTYGALNAIGLGAGSSDLAVAMATGKMWFQVPDTIKIILEGSLKKGVTAKDIALKIIQTLGSKGASYRAIEFHGKAIESLDMSDRLTICNMVVESGAECGIMPFDEVTKEWFRETRFQEIDRGITPDDDASYCQIIQININNLTPLISTPHKVDNVFELNDFIGTPIGMVVVGTCTNGRLKDLYQVAQFLKHYDIASGVELLVIPASRNIYLQTLDEGIMKILVEKGAIILPPGCGPCCGSSAGIPSDGENVLSTANRNFLGRMGNTRANIYLGSPLAAAAAAVTGKITDPRRFENIEI